MRNAFRLTTICVIAVVGALAWTGVARAQTDTPELLKAEVERLKSENADLKNQVGLLQGQLAAAQTTIAVLRGQGGAPISLEKLAPIPPDPLAAPAAMLAELIRRYERDLGGLARADEAQYHGAVEKWAKAMGRTMRGRAEWLVTINDVREEEPDRYTALLRVIEEGSGLPIGEPWRGEFPARFVEKVRLAHKQAPADHTPLWRATVLLSAEPGLDWDRAEAGPYNAPPFVGPFVEFGFGLDWVVLIPADKQLPGAPVKPAEKPKAPATGPR